MVLHGGGRGFRAAIISVVFAIALYAGYAFWSDAGRFGRAVGAIGWGETALILGLSAFNYGLRCLRWRLFLAHLGHRLPARVALLNYLSGFALTTTPGKAGEAIRSMQLKERCAVPVADSLAAFFAERFSDVLALIVLAAFAVLALPGGAWFAAAAGLFVTFALWVAASDTRTRALAGVVARALPSRFAEPLARMLAQAGRLTRGAPLLAGLVLALVAWAAEGYALYVIVEAMGTAIGTMAGVGVYSVSLLAGALFFLPGGLGSTEAIMVLLLVRSGMEAPAAGAATVVSRVTTLWFAVALGWIAWGAWALERPRASSPTPD